jgi:uncharacterized protein YlaI
MAGLPFARLKSGIVPKNADPRLHAPFDHRPQPRHRHFVGRHADPRRLRCNRAASSIAGEIPPDQSLPEVWVSDDSELEAARELLHQLRHGPTRHWVCRACHERVDGPFEQCWNCGAAMPAP